MEIIGILTIIIIAGFYGLFTDSLVEKLSCGGDGCLKRNWFSDEENNEEMYKSQKRRRFYISNLMNVAAIIAAMFILIKNINNAPALGVMLGAYLSLFFNCYNSWNSISLDERIGVGFTALAAITGSFYVYSKRRIL